MRNGKREMMNYIALKDSGLCLGYGVFETLRVYDGQPYLLREHIKRLEASCRALFFPTFAACETVENLEKLVYKYIAEHKLESRALRLAVTHGNAMDGLEPAIFMTDRGIDYEAADYEQGVAVVFSPYRKNEYSPIVSHKTFNQLENVIALKEAGLRAVKDEQLSRAGTLTVKECIFLNTSGYVAEGSKSNIFFVRDAVVYTPTLECGILPGITRRHVIDLLREKRIKVIEGFYREEFLYKCDECFCTNSLMEVLPVVWLDGKPIGSGSPGEISLYTLSLYREQQLKTNGQQPSSIEP